MSTPIVGNPADSAVYALNRFGSESGLHQFVSDYAWLGLVAFLLLLFKSQVESAVSGLQVFLGSGLNEDDVVIVDGRPGRVARVGMSRTVFYLYTYREGKIVGGTKLAVPNTALSAMRIEKPLEHLETEDYWKASEGPNGHIKQGDK